MLTPTISYTYISNVVTLIIEHTSRKSQKYRYISHTAGIWTFDQI